MPGPRLPSFPAFRARRAWLVTLALAATALPALCDVVVNPPIGASQPICVDGIAQETAYSNTLPLGFEQGSLYQREPDLADSTVRILVAAIEENRLRQELVIAFRTSVTGLRSLARNEPLFAADVDIRFGGAPIPCRLWVVGGRRAGELAYLVDRGRDGTLDTTTDQSDIGMAAGGSAEELVVEISIPLEGRKATAAPASRVDGYVLTPDTGSPGQLIQRHIVRSDYTLGAGLVVTASNQAVPYRLEIDVDYSNQGNKINLSQSGVLRVVVLSSSRFDATTELDRATIRLGDPTLTGRAAPGRSQDHDQNGDGFQDLILFFDVQSLVNNGALNAATSRLALTALTRDPNPADALLDVDPLYGEDRVTVTP